MEIVNSFDEVIIHYKNKITYAEDELNMAIRNLIEIDNLIHESWQAPSGDAFSERLIEKKASLKKIQMKVEEMQKELDILQESIQGNIDTIMQMETI